MTPSFECLSDNQGEVRTENTPAQEKLTPDKQDSSSLSAEQVYIQRQSETTRESHLSNSAFVP